MQSIWLSRNFLFWGNKVFDTKIVCIGATVSVGAVFSCDELYILLPLIALLSTLPPINPPLNGGLAIMPDFYAITRGVQTTVQYYQFGLNRIFLSLHKGPLLTGGVPLHRTWDGWIKVSGCVAYFLWQMWHAEPLHRLRFQLIYILRPPIPEVNDDVAAVCKFNDAGNVKLESF